MKIELVPGGVTYEDLVTTSELAEFARVSDPNADSNLRKIATGVFHHLERELGRAIIEQDVTVQVPIPEWGYGYGRRHWEQLKLPLPPVRSIDSVKWREWDGTEYTVDSSKYVADVNCEPSLLRFVGSGYIYPSTLTEPCGKAHFIIKFRSGYAMGDFPAGLLLVAKRIISTHYENPENTIAGIDESVLLLPAQLADTMELYRIVDMDVEYGE